MQDPQTGEVPPYQQTYSDPPAQSYPPPAYNAQPPNGYSQPPYPPLSAGDGGLSDTAAGALAYVTIIPAIVFLLIAPYNTRPFVKFHAFQCLGLAVTWFCLGIIGIIPILGWIVVVLGALALLVVWIMSLVKASQGSYLKLPLISDFAAQQSGWAIR